MLKVSRTLCFLLASVLCLQTSVFCDPNAVPEKMPKSSRAVLDASASNVRSYDQLVHAIREVQHASETRIETAVEQEKVREAWETGKLIQEHILLNNDRAEYGEKVMIKLSQDLEISQSELSLMLQFARAYPNYAPGNNLSWSHYRSLLSLNDPAERESVAKKAEKENWNREQVRHEVQRRKTAVSSPNVPIEEPKLTEVKPGKIGVYPVLEINGKKYYDLGFAIYSEVKDTPARDVKIPAGSPQTIRDEELYTYNAQVTEIYDGDTFYARIDLGFGTLTTQQLRLRRIDAPELVSADGKEAKQVLEKILNRDKGRIVIKTSKGEDQFGRYLVDIWVCSARSDKASADGTQTTRDECKGKAIEQELLDSEVFDVREDV